MPTTWIVVAHQGGARIFESRGTGRPLVTAEELPFPWGRLKTQDLVSDRRGQAFESARPGQRPIEFTTDPKRHAVERFAKTLAERLGRGRVDGTFDRLVLIAEPRFLGMLREALDHPTEERVVASLDKDLHDASGDDVRKQLEDVILV